MRRVNWSACCSASAVRSHLLGVLNLNDFSGAQHRVRGRRQRVVPMYALAGAEGAVFRPQGDLSVREGGGDVLGALVSLAARWQLASFLLAISGNGGTGLFPGLRVRRGAVAGRTGTDEGFVLQDVVGEIVAGYLREHGIPAAIAPVAEFGADISGSAGRHGSLDGRGQRMPGARHPEGRASK